MRESQGAYYRMPGSGSAVSISRAGSSDDGGGDWGYNVNVATGGDGGGDHRLASSFNITQGRSSSSQEDNHTPQRPELGLPLSEISAYFRPCYSCPSIKPFRSNLFAPFGHILYDVNSSRSFPLIALVSCLSTKRTRLRINPPLPPRARAQGLNQGCVHHRLLLEDPHWQLCSIRRIRSGENARRIAIFSGCREDAQWRAICCREDAERRTLCADPCDCSWGDAIWGQGEFVV